MSAHTPTPWIFDEVKTSCGRAFRIGSAEIIANHEASKRQGARTLPAYACIYDDYGTGETVNKANAAFIVESVNNAHRLRLEKKDDGIWLHVVSSTGSSALINVTPRHRDGIVMSVLLDACK